MTQTDLFPQRLSDKDLLCEFMKQKRWARTSEIIRFGSEHFSNRADRNARQLAREGLIRRMNKQLQDLRFGKIGERVWEWCGDD